MPDMVSFYSAGGELLADAELMSGDYNPGENNTYYFRRTILEGDNVVSGYGEEFTEATSIDGNTLYLNRFSFMVDKGTEPTIQIGDGEVITLSKDSSDSSIYSYTIPEGTGADTQTMITITDDGNTYNFFWSDLTYNTVGISNNFAVVSESYETTPGGKKAVYFDAT